MEKFDVVLLEKLGKLTAQIRKDVSPLVKIGVSITTLIDFVEKKIFDEGYLPAFPCTISINEIAAHYTVFEEDFFLKKGDVVKIDFGISHEGFITDNAFTIEVEDTKYEKLLLANMKGLNAAIENTNIGTPLSIIGGAVNKIAKEEGFNTIHNLSGHEIGKNNLHYGLSIPNYNNNDMRTISDSSEYAIEPFFTLGDPKVKNGGNSNILHLINYRPVRDPIAKKILNYIKENYEHLPFSKRWLIKDIITKLNPKQTEGFDTRKVLYALKILKQQDIIHEYEKLVTVDGSIVSQFEDTVLFVNGKKKIITRI